MEEKVPFQDNELTSCNAHTAYQMLLPLCTMYNNINCFLFD